MIRITLVLAEAACAIVFATAVQAEDVQYVSTKGKDTNPCTLAAPCRTLQRGIGATPIGGEVQVLNSGEYGPEAKIDKSITINGNRFTVLLDGPITVTEAKAAVVLRELVLNGRHSTGDAGINILSARVVHINNCVVHGYGPDGISFAANGKLFLSDSLISDNGDIGLRVGSVATTANVTVDNARFENNGDYSVFIFGSTDAVIKRTVVSGSSFGIGAANAARVTAVSSLAANNKRAGYVAFPGSQMTLESSAAIGNRTGLLVRGGGIARASNSAFVNNNVGIHNNEGGTLLTRQNNTVAGNETTSVGALTPLGAI